MSYAIASQNPNQPNLPVLIFGTFKGDTLSQLQSGVMSIREVPIDDVAELGTDVLPMFDAIGQEFAYADPNANFALTVYGEKRNPAGDIKSYGSIGATDKKSGNGASLLPFPVADSKNVDRENAYLMYTEINGEFIPYVLTKWLDGKGKLTYSLKGPSARPWFDVVIRQFKEYTPYTPPGAAGGFGTGDKTSDPVDFPGLPIVSALNTGVVNMYKANSVTLRAFSEYLWKGDFVDNVKKLFQDPMEAVVSIQIVPYTPSHADTASDVYLSWINTGVQMNPLTNQYVALDCGSLIVSEFWSSFLDYPPHTDVSIYLPYIGVKQLSVQDVMNRTIHLRYHIDVLTGSCVAMLKCSGGGLDSVMYSWNGSCNIQMPISARDFSSIYSSVLSLAASAGLAIATKGASKALTAGAAAGAAASALNSLDLDTHTRQAGSPGSVPGYLGKQTPYLIITRPKDSTPENFNELNGRPSNLGGKVGEYSGFLSLSAVHIDGIVATEKEKGMIESVLKSGILI